MQTPDDISLVREFARQQNEAAFETLVARHVNLVYSAALRQTGDAHTAEEVTQAVFLVLARKAGSLSGGWRQRLVTGPNPLGGEGVAATSLTPWLFKTTRFAAAAERRTRIRRLHRETQAYMDTSQITEAEAWPQIAPLLDEALASLGETDRRAVLLRYFENKPLAEVGTALGVNEDAARKRVNRGIEKLRKLFGKRGVTLTAAVIASVVGANSVQAAPVGLVVKVSIVAAKGAAVTTSITTMVKGALKIMAWTKAKTAILICVSVLLAAGVMTIVIKESKSKVSALGMDIYISDTDLEDYQKAPPLLVIQPTHFPKFQGIMGHSDGADGKLVGRDQTIKDLIAVAYKFNIPRIIFPDNMPTNHYDYLVTVTNHFDSFEIMPGSRHQLFQAEIAKTLGYTARIETWIVDCQVIKVASLGGGKLKAGNSSQSPQLDYTHAPTFDYPDEPLSALAEALQYRFRMPVIDQTGLVGKYYMVMDWHWKGDWRGKDREANLNSLKKALFDQFGLDLVSSREPVEMLVVEKVK